MTVHHVDIKGPHQRASLAHSILKLQLATPSEMSTRFALPVINYMHTKRNPLIPETTEKSLSYRRHQNKKRGNKKLEAYSYILDDKY